MNGSAPSVTILVTGFAVCPIALYGLGLDASLDASKTTNGDSHLSTALHDLDLGSKGPHSLSGATARMEDGANGFVDNDSINPSSMIVSLLPLKLPATSTHPTAVNIISYPYPIRVSYQEVRSIVPKLHNHFADQVDMVLHLGMAPERPNYYLETEARRDGYYHLPDVDGVTLEKGDGVAHWPDCPTVLHTSLEHEDVLDRWRENISSTPEISSPKDGVHVEYSNNAGHYLCNFMYYSSLAEYHRRSKSTSNNGPPLPVIFMHAPGRSKGEDIKKGGLVTRALIHALAESWMDSRRSKRSNY